MTAISPSPLLKNESSVQGTTLLLLPASFFFSFSLFSSDRFNVGFTNTYGTDGFLTNAHVSCLPPIIMKAVRSCSHGYGPLIKTTHSHHSCVFLCVVLVHRGPLREIRVALTELSPARSWLTFHFLFRSFLLIVGLSVGRTENSNKQKQNKSRNKQT